MTKTDLVDVIAGKVKISKVAALEAVDAFTDSITGALKKGDKVTLIGFGTFDVAKRAAREGVNPQTRFRPRMGCPFLAGSGFSRSTLVFPAIPLESSAG